MPKITTSKINPKEDMKVKEIGMKNEVDEIKMMRMVKRKKNT